MKTSTTSKKVKQEKDFFYIAYGKENLLFTTGGSEDPSKVMFRAKDNLKYDGYTIKEYGPIKVEKCSEAMYDFLMDTYNYEKHCFFAKHDWSRDESPSPITDIAEKGFDGIWELKSVIQKQKQEQIIEKNIDDISEKDFLQLTTDQKLLFLFRELSNTKSETIRKKKEKQDKEKYYY